MLNDKLCAVLLLDRIQEKLNIEGQYIKSDVIFYKIKDSNIAVSKKLNNIDFSILSPEDWNYLLDHAETEESKKKYTSEYIEDSAKKYSFIIHEWSEKSSILAKIESIINLDSLNNSSISDIKKNIKANGKILDLLINNKFTISDTITQYYNQNNALVEEPTREDIKLDVNIERVYNSIGDWERVEILFTGSDHNINTVKNTIGEDDSIEDLNNVDLLLAFLIIKYHIDKDEPVYKRYYRTLYRVKIELDRNFNVNDDFRNWLKTEVSNILSGGGRHYNQTPCQTILRNSARHHNNIAWELRRDISNNLVTLNVDYASMTDQELLLFKKSVENLIDFHAKYISVNEKEIEGYVLFLGRRVLEGKRKTKELLTTHLNLPNMYSEIGRRGL